MKSSFIAAAIILLLASTAAFSWEETTLAGRSVSVGLVRSSDFSPSPWPSGDFRLTAATIVTRQNANVFDLLTANGIQPDVEALTLVYDLNPSLKKLDPLPESVNLVLPKLSGEALEQILRGEYRVVLTVDRTIRDEMAKSLSELQELSTRFAALADERFANPSGRGASERNVRELVVWFEHIQRTFLQRTGPPLRRQTLLGLRDEAAALNSILVPIARGGEKVNQAAQEEIEGIYKDVQVQMTKYDNIMAGEPPTAEVRYEVMVTIRNGDQIKDPQVYYAWEGLFRKPPKAPLMIQPFEAAVSGSLTFGDYVIWVGTPDHPFPPLTDQKPIRIEGPAGNTRKMVLTAIP